MLSISQTCDTVQQGAHPDAPGYKDFHQYFSGHCIFIMVDITNRMIFVLVMFWITHNWTTSCKNDLIQLNTTLRNTTDSVLCQRSLRIQCKYDTTEYSGSISMTTQSVIWMWLVMKRKLPVVSLHYAPYNLSRNHTFKPPNTCERVSVWNIFIIRNTTIDIFSPRWWWWWWCIWWWWWWCRRRQWSCWRLFALTMKTAVVVIICFDNGVWF